MATAEQRSDGMQGWWRPLLSSDYLVLGLAAIYFLIALRFVPGLGSNFNLRNLGLSLLPLLILGAGQTFVLIIGGIDLSIAAIIGLSSVVGAMLMTAEGGLLAGSPWATAVGVAAMLGIGLLIGAINGALISGFRMPAFIVTLSSMMFFNGVALWITKSKNIYSLPEPFLALGQKPMVLVPLSLGLAVIAHILLTRFLHGRWFHAIGHNPVASAISGVPVRRTTILVYMLSGLFAAASSVLLTAKLETGSAVIGRYVFLDVIGAAVIGGTSLFGGKGSIRGTAFGVLFIAIIGNSLDLLGLSQFAILIIKGMVVLVAALVDAERNRMLTGRSGK